MNVETIIKVFTRAGAANLYYTDPVVAQRVAHLLVKAEQEAVQELLGALQDLLMDTQHAEHECGDKNCPVAHARRVALKYDARGQA